MTNCPLEGQLYINQVFQWAYFCCLLFVWNIVKFLNLFRELVRQHGIDAIFIAVFYRGLVVPAFKLEQGKGFLHGFDLIFHGSFSGLEQLLPFLIAGLTFYNPLEELLDLFYLETGLFETFDDTDGF